jgi:hypothetical protein
VRVLTGAFGIGLARSVRQMYESLARVYAPGDQIYLFGFSRGAFAARTLAGMITRCGIPRPQTEDGGSARLRKTVRAAYRQYRRCFRSLIGRAIRRTQTEEQIAKELAAFRAKYVFEPDRPTEVRFVGVWDTVDAVGSPFRIAEIVNMIFYQFKFSDRHLSRHVKRGCHALALDEERASFTPVLWMQRTPEDKQRIEQTWFAGVHSNVGGGYAKQGMSLVALDWMMDRAEQEGLEFVRSDRDFYRNHHSVNDELANSRAYLGVFYRWNPRNVNELCSLSGNAPVRIHASVFERVGRGTGAYTPGNIPPHCEVVATRHPAVALHQIGDFVAKAHGDDKPSLLEQMPDQVWVGRLSYTLFVIAIVALGGGALFQYVSGVKVTGFADFVSAVASLGSPGTWWETLKAFALAHRIVIGVIGTLLLSAGLLSASVGLALENSYSRFWGRNQQALRQLMGL